MQRSLVIYPVLIFIAGLVAYSNSLGNGFTFDDRAIVVGNPVVQTLDPGRIFSSPWWHDRAELGLYRPVTTLSYALNYRLHGLAPYGYHLVNLFLHLLNGTLVFWIFFRALGHAPSAGVAALVFVLHPVQTEAVNGVVGRAELLSAFWVLFAWALYTGASEAQGRARQALYGASLFAALLACFSKEHGVMLVGILAAYDLLLLFRRGAPDPFRQVIRYDALRYVPYVLVVLLYLAIRYAVIGAVLLPGKPLLVDNPLAHLPTGERMLTAIAVIGKYAGLLVLPYRLSADYSYDQIPAVTSLFNPGFLVGALVGAGVLFVVVQATRRRWAAAWGFGAVFLVLTLLPVSNLFFPIGTVLGERLLYLPSLGFCLLLGWAYRVLDRRRALPWAVPAGAVLLLGAYGVGTYLRNPDWKDDFALFSSAVQAAPRSAKAHFNLGNAHRDRGDMEGALREYHEALQIHPAYAEAHYNAGVIYQQHVRMPDRAIKAYSRALMADSSHVLSWINVGALLGRKGRFAPAAEAFEKALALDPEHLDARYNFALACQEAGRSEEAAQAYQQVLEVDPGHVDAAINLGALYREAGYSGETIAVYRRLLKVRPDAFQVAFNLGVLLEAMGRPTDAVGAYEQASRAEDERGALSLFKVGELYHTDGEGR